MPDGLQRFYNVVFVSWDYYYRVVVWGWMYSVAAVGLVAHFIGVILGLLSLYMVRKDTMSFLKIKKLVVVALSLESLYYASLIPSVIWLLALVGLYGNLGFTYTLGIAYVLQIIFTVPFLAILAFKVNKYDGDPKGFQSWKWVGIAFSGYVVALWANAVLRWFDMVMAEGVIVFFSGITGLGALNAFVFMSLAVIFAVIGTYSYARHRRGAILRWFALSLMMVGLHYVFYVVYSYLVGALNSVWIIDVWAISLLGLGLSMLKMKRLDE